jgi:hypothetical protein
MIAKEYYPQLSNFFNNFKHGGSLMNLFHRTSHLTLGISFLSKNV